MFLRTKKRLRFMEIDEEPPDIADSPPDTSGLTADSVYEALAQLPDGYRTVFNLFAIEGKSHKEIGKLLNIKPDTSASQYYRARTILAKILKKQQAKEEKK